MLTKLIMKNFRKHTDTTINFTPGINAIRAQNEAGKSTLIEAICYALFGSRALKETLDDVVTYDTPVSKLKVELEFEHAGVPHRITRGKSGAEIYVNGNDTPLVIGQTETVKYVERLLGASQDMAGKLMLARQKDLGGALADGPTAAGKMIEDLANLGLIEDLIGLIGEKLPSGNTATTEGMIAGLKAQADVEYVDVAPLQQAVEASKRPLTNAEGRLSQLKAEADNLDTEAARQILADEKALQQRATLTQGDIDRVNATLARVLPAPVDQAEIARLQSLVEQEKQYGVIAGIHAELVRANIEPGQWDQPFDTLEAEIRVTGEKVKAAEAVVKEITEKARQAQLKVMSDASALREEITRTESKLIKETSCALCGKDLADVPEVAQINNPLSAKLTELHAQLETLQQGARGEADQYAAQLVTARAAADEVIGYLNDLAVVDAAHDNAERLYAKASQYITVDRSVVPGIWTWTGPEIGGTRPDYAGKLSELQRDNQNALAAAAAREAALAQLGTLQETKATIAAELAALPLADARETLERHASLQSQIAEATTARNAAHVQLQQSQQALVIAEATNQAAELAAEKAKANLKAAEESLAEMQSNNALIKKLREARPKITDKLWTMVLAAVSTYLGEVRGEPSQITRADGKFMINGRPVSGLSGSAEDALGLANRLGLTKMFLPNVDFLILDEVAAACDDAREEAMLGLLATVGFDQVILVTHSPQVDAFAQNVITF